MTKKTYPRPSRRVYSARHPLPLTWDRVRTVRQGGGDAVLALVSAISPIGYLSAIWRDTAHAGNNGPGQSERRSCNPGALRPWRLWL